jgi:hypothetical protein
MYKQSISEQKYTNSVLLQKKLTLSFIAGAICVSISKVSREICCNFNNHCVYDDRLTLSSLGGARRGTLVTGLSRLTSAAVPLSSSARKGGCQSKCRDGLAGKRV